jgi:SAM-dependent methyltransferase
VPACAVCGSRSWRALPDPHEARSVTTAGLVLREPLGKAHCGDCGLAQRVRSDLVGAAGRYYEDHYRSYFERPGTAPSEQARYQATALWMQQALGGRSFQRILDVGCGRGSQLSELSKLQVDSAFAGVEPSRDAAEAARQDGWEVVDGRIEEEAGRLGHFDLVYANNVLQHVVSPREFLGRMRSLLLPGGRLLLTCPWAGVPSNELLWADQSYSFSPEHLWRLAEQVDLRVETWAPAPPAVASLLDKQLVVLAPGPGPHAHRAPARDADFGARVEYLAAWASLDACLLERAGDGSRLLNFGASMWTHLLRGYCPRYWELVNACVIDGKPGVFMEKPLLSSSELGPGDVVVLGTNPASQASLRSALLGRVLRTVSWDDRIVR